MKVYFKFRLALIALFFSVLHAVSAQNNRVAVTSPSKLVVLNVSLNRLGTPSYSVNFNGKSVIRESSMGLRCDEGDFSQGLTWVKNETASKNETWKPVWGEEEQIKDQYNELLYSLQNGAGVKFNIRFRVYDDGVGFRYEMPENDKFSQMNVRGENSEFRMSGDHKTWWIPADWDSNEHVYSTTNISGIDGAVYARERSIYTKTIKDVHGVQTPVTMKAADGLHLCIHEAALIDYPAMQLHIDHKTLKFSSILVPAADSTLMSVNTLPFKTPWRAIIITRNAADLLKSRLILNLNEPSTIADPSFITPQKYVGVWWEMHIGKGSWDYAGGQDMNMMTERKPHGKHAATTENVKKYIDFAAKYGFAGVLVEGWNEGWEDWFGKMKPETFDFAKPYPDYDIEALTRYAQSKGVRIIAHHETSSAVPSYERQMDAAYAFMKKHRQNAVKTGYVGFIQPKGEHHDGQWMINHYVRVAQKTAQNGIMLCAHEPVRPTGLHRTYPNWMACEAARGQEFNAWSTGNPPEHETILPFTRIMGGPMDYTPGVFEVRMSAYDPNKKEVVHSTVAKQLALYVTLYSPLQMACDLPENYEKRLDVFQFIRDVPTDWSESRYIHASIGDYLTIARRQKGGSDWYVGSITDENPRNFTLKLDFLEPGKMYEATIYADGPEAHWESNPYPVGIVKKEVRRGDALQLVLAAGGGCAISIKAKK